MRKERKLYTFAGKTGTLKALCEEFNINYKTVQNRLKAGMTIEDALSMPVKKRNADTYTYENKTGSLKYLCKEFNKNYATVINRMHRGMTLEEAFQKPLGPTSGRIYSYQGEQGTLRELCDAFHKNYRIISDRINHRDMSIEKAFTLPFYRINKDKTYQYRETSGTMQDLCDVFHKDFQTVYDKMCYELYSFEYAMDSTLDQ